MIAGRRPLTAILNRQRFLIFVGLILWLAIFRIGELQRPTWSNYLLNVSMYGLALFPILVMAFFQKEILNFPIRKRVLIWLGSFLIPVAAYFILLAVRVNSGFTNALFTAVSSAVALELLLILNYYYQQRVQQAGWFKKIGLENSVLITLVLIALLIAVMGVSSIDNPLYHTKERLLIGFEFSPVKVVSHFWTFVSFFVQFLLMYLCGYLFFFINSRILVSKVLKQNGLLMYVLCSLTTVVLFYPLVAQLLISLPINETLGRDIFSNNAFEYENAFGVMGVLLISLPVVLALQWGKQNNRILLLEKEKSQTELDLLKQQLNPHFFFNTLNNLYALSLQKSPKTPESILQLAELMRYTIYKGQEETVSLEQEIRYTEDYVNLQMMRLKKTLRFQFDKEINNDQLKIAPLLLVVLIENAFKHGIEPAEGAATLTLQLRSRSQDFTFICENSFETAMPTKPNGIGLNNLRKRLELLYPSAHQLEISTNKGIFRAELTIRFK